MDYDLTDIPAGYDRGRDHGPEFMKLWMDELGLLLNGKRINGIIDMGCGTGRFSEGLAVRFDTTVYGIDPSRKMLEQALAKKSDDRVQYMNGQSEFIPFPSRSVDMVFMSMSFHHFKDPGGSIRECRRVLREQGIAILRTGTLEQVSSYPFVPFFPSSRLILEDILMDFKDTRSLFESEGFRMTNSKIINQTIAPDWKSYAEKLSARGDSVLIRLSEEEFNAGLNNVSEYASDAKDTAVTEPIDLFIFGRD